MSARWVALGSLALGLVGCGEEDSNGLGRLSYPRMPGCEQIDSAPCDTMQPGCQQVRLELAACLRGSEPGELPPVTLWTEQQYGDALTALLAESPRPTPDHYERALSLLHLVEPGAFSPGPAVMNQVSWVWGFYDPEERDITIIDHGQPADDDTSNALLLHELVHALQDRDVTLRAFHEEHDGSFDAMLASTSIVEGEAELHESHYVAALLGLDPTQVDWREHFTNRIANGDKWVLEQSSPLVATRSDFPYAYGQRFVDFAWQAGGHQALLALFAAPPTSTQVLLASTDAPNASFTPVELVAPTAPSDWSFVADDTLGAWALYLVLTRSATTPDVRAAALAWRGDRLSIYSGPTTDTALAWQLELGDEASAALVETNLQAQLGGTWVRRQGTRVVAAAATAAVALDWAFVTQ